MIQWPKQRAWGWYATLIRTPWFCVKLLRFRAKGRLSMQRHFNRTEIWCFLKGRGYSRNSFYGNYYGENWCNRPFQIWKIDKGQWHQFTAPEQPVYALELQYGKKVTEEDIERK